MKNKNKINFFLVGFLSVLISFFIFNPAKKMNGATDTDQVTLSTTIAQALTLSCGSDVSLGTLTPGVPVTGSSTCTVATNAVSGYDLQVKRDDADTTLDKTDEASENIDDKTDWDPTANTGAGNAATWSGTGLGFTVYASTATKDTTWWGTGTTVTDANNKYAGFPSAYATIMDHDSYSSSSTTADVGYKLDVASTQKSGTYDGSITYQAVSKP